MHHKCVINLLIKLEQDPQPEVDNFTEIQNMCSRSVAKSVSPVTTSFTSSSTRAAIKTSSLRQKMDTLTKRQIQERRREELERHSRELERQDEEERLFG